MNYAETPVAGTKWVRAKRVIIDNRLGELPIATFFNEEVYRFDDTVILKDVGINVTAGIGAEEVIPILDPNDDTSVNSLSYQEVVQTIYDLLYSVHRYVIQK